MVKYKLNGKWVSKEEAMKDTAGLPYGTLFTISINGTDDQYMGDARRGGDLARMSDFTRNAALAAAKRAGVSLNGKKHISGLGVATDMRSWVDSKGDIVRRAKTHQTVTIDGKVVKQAEPVPPPKRKPLADDIVRDCVEERIAKNPALAGNIDKVVDDVLQDHAPKWK
jgi:hypothetical protein